MRAQGLFLGLMLMAATGLPASQAMLNAGYQMIVAHDGAVVYADGISHRIRRIAPGADGVVNGGPDEIVQTIASYFTPMPPNPSNFATSEYGDYRGLVEDPLSPGRFIVASQGHKLERFGTPGAAANQAPTVSIQFPPSVQYADSPAGGTIFLNAIASDPDGDFLTYSWTGPFTDNPATTNSFLVAHLAVGTQQTIAFTVDDGRGGTASASIRLDMIGAPFIGTTSTPVDSAFGSGFLFTYTPVTVTAAGVPAGTSHTFLKTHVDQVPPIPSSLQAGSPPIYFDVSTDAAFLLAPINICIDTRGMSFPVPSSIRLYQYTSTGPLQAWTDITQTVNNAANQLCGSTNALGTFAIFYQQVPATAIRTIAGNGVFTATADPRKPSTPPPASSSAGSAARATMTPISTSRKASRSIRTARSSTRPIFPTIYLRRSLSESGERFTSRSGTCRTCRTIAREYQATRLPRSLISPCSPATSFCSTMQNMKSPLSSKGRCATVASRSTRFRSNFSSFS
jgi:hypothetical protein